MYHVKSSSSWSLPTSLPMSLSPASPPCTFLATAAYYLKLPYGNLNANRATYASSD